MAPLPKYSLDTVDAVGPGNAALQARQSPARRQVETTVIDCYQHLLNIGQ